MPVTVDAVPVRVARMVTRSFTTNGGVAAAAVDEYEFAVHRCWIDRVVCRCGHASGPTVQPLTVCRLCAHSPVCVRRARVLTAGA